MQYLTEKPHYNLYYIFEADKREHPMPQQAVDAIRATLERICANRRNTEDPPDAPTANGPVPS